MLFNSEAWHSISEPEIRILEMVDEHLLRSMVEGHSKTPLEFLYLEAGALPIRFIITSRRVIYLQSILKRPEDELVRRVYYAQKENPVNGDFVKLIQADFDLLGAKFTENEVISMSKEALKTEVKKMAYAAAFKYLTNKQQQHSKVHGVKYKKLQTQAYILSPLFKNTEVNLLHALRSRMINVKANFSSKYRLSLLCPVCESAVDEQQHILECDDMISQLKSDEIAVEKSEYKDLFENEQKQKRITNLFERLLKIRNSLVDENLVKKTNPSITAQMLKNSDNLHKCIVHYTLGK